MIRLVLRKLGMFLVSFGEQQRPDARAASKSAFEQRGRRLLAAHRKSSPTITAGSIQLVGLNDLRRALGAKWTDVAGRARAIGEIVIRKHLTNLDIYTAQDDGTFVLFFAAKGQAEAERTARLISDEIKAAITQQIPSLAHALDIDHFVAEVDSDIVFEDERPLSDVLFDSLSQIRCEAEDSVRRRRAALIRDAQVVFRPIWHCGKRAILLFRCMLGAASGSAAIEHFGAISDPDQLQSAIADLDFLVFGKAVESLHRLLQKNSKAIFLIPLHFQTAANKPSRDEYIRLCQKIPEQYKKFIFFEMHGIPVGTATSRIAQISAALQPFCHGVIIEISAKHQSVGSLEGASIRGVSLSVSDAPIDSIEYLASVKRTITIARTQNFLSIAHGANTIGQLQAVIDIGFDYVNGEAVHASFDEPKAAFKFNPLSPSGEAQAS